VAKTRSLSGGVSRTRVFIANVAGRKSHGKRFAFSLLKILKDLPWFDKHETGFEHLHPAKPSAAAFEENIVFESIPYRTHNAQIFGHDRPFSCALVHQDRFDEPLKMWCNPFAGNFL
jgi:hypothetical protein